MAKEARIKLIKEIESLRGSRVICFVTSDRKSTETNLNLMKQIDDETPSYLYKHLNTEVPKKIVDLLREYTDNLGVIVPFRAHSAATMIALGADEILMNEMSELTPIDPSVTTPFNPANPTNSSQKLPIESEAILSFRDSFKYDFGLKFRSGKIAELLIQQLHPIVIGSAYRARCLVKFIVQKFLKHHISGPCSFLKIRKVINALLRSTSHSLSINFKEAQSLGLNVTFMDIKLKNSVWNLYEEYEKECKLKSTFNPVAFLSSQPSAVEEFPKLFLESTERTDVCMGKITLNPTGPGQARWVVEENWVIQ